RPFANAPSLYLLYTLSLHDALPIFLHRGQDEIARAVQNAVQRQNLIRRQALADVGDDRNSARDRRFKSDRAAQLASAVEQFRPIDRKSTRLNSSHDQISYAVFCLKK